jgi:glycosyltransferase involved in cell wall biosynthesis
LRILIVTPYLPHPHVGHGGGTAVRQFIRALAERHEVAVLSLRRPSEHAIADAALGDGVHLETVPFRDQSAHGWSRLLLAKDRTAAGLRAWRSGLPVYAAKYHHAPLLRRATELVHAFQPDVVQIEYLQLAAVLHTLRRARGAAERPRLILSSHEHGALPRRRRAQRARGLQRAWLESQARAWDRLACEASGAADRTLCVTDQDRTLLAAAGARRLVTVPLGIDVALLRAERPAVTPQRILFLGSFGHPPNRDAAARLCRDVWPAVRARRPDWELVLAGPGSDEFVSHSGLDGEGVRALGFVADLDELFAASGLFVAPLFEGGGIKIKILEAMARGIPLVTTPIGAEGIVAREQDLVGWAERPDDLVEATLAAIDDPEAARERATRARRHVEEAFGWPAVIERLESVYRDPSSG